jgi:O-antigen ligase
MKTLVVSQLTSHGSLALWGVLLIPIIVFALFPLAGIFVLVALLGLGICFLVIKKPRFLFYLIGFFISYEIGFSAEALFGINFTPVLVLSLLTLLIVLLKILTSHRVRAIPMFGWWLAFTGFAAITYAHSPGVVGSVQGIWFVFRLAFTMALVYPAFCWFLTKREHVQTFLVIMAISAAISGLVAVIQTLSGGNLLSGVLTNDRFLGFLWKFPPDALGADPAMLKAGMYINNIFRGHGTFYRPNGFGAFMSIIIGLTWGLFRRERGRRRLIFALLLAAQVAGVIVTFSRTAWAAILAALAAALVIEMFFWSKKRLSRQHVQLAVVAVLGGIVFLGIALQSNAISERFNTLLNPGQVAEVQWRIYIWKIAFQSILANPWFGTGISTVASNVPYLGPGDFGAHNLFIGLAYERGLPALCIFLFLVGTFFISTWKWMKSEHEIPEKALATGLFAAGVALLVGGMGSALLDIENFMMMFWILLAIAVIFERKQRDSRISKVCLP